jgi:hypothetical protein
MVEFWGAKPDWIPANGLGAGDRSKRRAPTSGLAWRELRHPTATSRGRLASAGEDPIAEEVKDTHARPQLTRSGRNRGHAQPSRLFASAVGCVVASAPLRFGNGEKRQPRLLSMRIG